MHYSGNAFSRNGQPTIVPRVNIHILLIIDFSFINYLFMYKYFLLLLSIIFHLFVYKYKNTYILREMKVMID